MILVKITINGELKRVAKEAAHLTHQWTEKIVSINPITYAITSNAGGYVAPIFGDIVFASSLFSDDWPPPRVCPVEFLLTDTTEEAAITVFSGNAYCIMVERDGVRFSLYGDSYTETLADKVIIDDDLAIVFSTYCAAAYLNVNFNDDYARATQPNVYREFDPGTPIIDMLSELAEAVNHLFYIRGGTLYLVDMLGDNGTDIELTGFDVRPLSYTYPVPHVRFESQGRIPYSVAGSYGFGEPFASPAAKNIEHIYARAGNNSGDDQVNLVHTDLIPYEPGRYYRITIKYRIVAGTYDINAGVVGVAADRSTLVNINGADSVVSQHSIVISGGTASSWTVKTGFAYGTSSTGDNTEHPSVSSPAALHTDVAYIRPWINAGAGGDTGEANIDSMEIVEVDSSGNELESLFYEDFYDGVSNQWVRVSGSGNRGIKTAKDESTANVEAALANLKTILELPRAPIRIRRIIAAAMPNPGQKLTWTAKSLCPTVNSGPELSVSGWTRARNITLDIDNDLLIVEGEGVIA